MYARYLAAQRARPYATAAATGLGVMGAGDASAQLLLEDGFSAQRNAVSSLYNGAVSAPFLAWFLLLERRWPGVSVGAMLRKVLTNQLIMTSINSPLYLLWSAHAEAWVAGRTDWAAVRAATLDQCVRELPGLIGASCVCWLPVNFVNFGFVPPHLKVPYMSAAGVCWGGYLSYVAHRGEAEAPPTGGQTSAAGIDR